MTTKKASWIKVGDKMILLGDTLVEVSAVTREDEHHVRVHFGPNSEGMLLENEQEIECES